MKNVLSDDGIGREIKLSVYRQKKSNTLISCNRKCIIEIVSIDNTLSVVLL